MRPALNDEPLSLSEGDTPTWAMWSKLVELSRHLRLDDWLLVGGQMVALHCHVAGVTPGRAMHLEPQPSLDGRHQHRFRNDEMILDVLVPDHTPKHLVLRLLGRDPVPIVGGARALQRAAYCSVDTVAGLAEIPIPDLRGALVLKARAWTSDTRDRDRHLFDLAQLSALIDDPLSFGECLDNKELRALRRVDMALAATSDPWLRIADARRAEAIEAWQTVTAP